MQVSVYQLGKLCREPSAPLAIPEPLGVSELVLQPGSKITPFSMFYVTLLSIF